MHACVHVLIVGNLMQYMYCNAHLNVLSHAILYIHCLMFIHMDCSLDILVFYAAQ